MSPLAAQPHPRIDGRVCWCACGVRFEGDSKQIAAGWYGHLADMVEADDDRDHSLVPF